MPKQITNEVAQQPSGRMIAALIIGNVLSFHIAGIFFLASGWLMLFLDSPAAMQFPQISFWLGVGSMLTLPISWILVGLKKSKSATIVALLPVIAFALLVIGIKVSTMGATLEVETYI